ncbi:MAG: hypothetical protein ABR538_14270 [Candidatus Binatia bacterium]
MPRRTPMPSVSLTVAGFACDPILAMAMALDTLAYARRLRQAGFSEQQAEGQAEALAAAMTDTLATKQDLMLLRQDAEVRFSQVDARFEYLERHIDTRFAEQEARIDAKLADLERRMTTRLGGITVAGIGVVSALVRIL